MCPTCDKYKDGMNMTVLPILMIFAILRSNQDSGKVCFISCNTYNSTYNLDKLNKQINSVCVSEVHKQAFLTAIQVGISWNKRKTL